jgi:AcrR family transcriptional regulator
MNQNRKPSATTRDPERTRRRILAAALAEFSAKGFAGARVDAIARRTGGNKRMLYHYFGNKAALFSAVLRFKTSQRRSWAAAAPKDPMERLPLWFQTACADLDWIRLLQWEALERPAKAMVNGPERRAAAVTGLRRMRRRQLDGHLIASFDLRHVALAMQSLTLFPAAFPQIVRLTTGQSLSDPKFQAAYRKFLAEFAAAFRPANGGKNLESIRQ